MLQHRFQENWKGTELTLKYAWKGNLVKCHTISGFDRLNPIFFVRE